MTARAGRDRVFARALFVSAILHLSAVTLFRIVIYFPREDIRYFDVAIVETAPAHVLSVSPPAIDAHPSGLDLAGPPLGETLSLQNSLPDIELPTLEFERLGLVRMRQEALQIRSRYDEVFSGDNTDAWRRLGSRLDTVGETLGRLAFGSPSAERDRPRPISRPAPGFEAYVEWLSEPRDRQALEVQPIGALRGLGPDSLPDPITLVFRVRRDGTVDDVVDPLGDSRGLVAAASEALRAYRFEPLLGDGPPTQGATFIVRAGDSS